MKIIESKTIQTRKVKRIELDRDAILELIVSHTDCGDLPENTTIYVQIPGGGDYSNTSLDINKNTPITIAWEEISYDQS